MQFLKKLFHQIQSQFFLTNLKKNLTCFNFPYFNLNLCSTWMFYNFSVVSLQLRFIGFKILPVEILSVIDGGLQFYWLHKLRTDTGRGGRAVQSMCQIQVDTHSMPQVQIPRRVTISIVQSYKWIVANNKGYTTSPKQDSNLGPKTLHSIESYYSVLDRLATPAGS